MFVHTNSFCYLCYSCSKIFVLLIYIYYAPYPSPSPIIITLTITLLAIAANWNKYSVHVSPNHIKINLANATNNLVLFHEVLLPVNYQYKDGFVYLTCTISTCILLLNFWRPQFVKDISRFGHSQSCAISLYFTSNYYKSRLKTLKLFPLMMLFQLHDFKKFFIKSLPTIIILILLYWNNKMHLSS